MQPPPPPPPLPPLVPAEDARKTAILSPRQNEYFIPRNGIDREVIAADIRPYLGNDAKVRPGTYEDKRTGRVVQGYFVTAYRNLTSAMINDLKADSVKWPQERMIHSGSSRRNAETRSPVTFPTNIYHDSAISNRRDQKEAARYPTAGTSEIHPNAAAQNPYYSGSHILPYLPQSQQLSQYTWYDWPYSDQPHGQPYSVLENRPEPRDTESHELHPIWLQIKALGSVNRTYTLPVDLRNEVERHFEPGTRDWLTRRIIPSLPDDNGETTLEAVLDTVLLLVFVWLYISERYVEVAQHVGLILKSGHDQRVIFVELVARVVAR
ncbi:hypothetical protein Daus18300_011570 [Diaporthe australafricana]|uniref:Uncharacterized protein n=1 Tax=Diaporthe australafricana TaxID=127596 RepID=A0ABR3W636_9PEZI